MDGDDFTLYEDPRLFPVTPQPSAVFYPKTPPVRLPYQCGTYQLAEFFASFMLNDIIGLVSSLHLRIADASPSGSDDTACKDLAKLHSKATDFRKSGDPVLRKELPWTEEPIVPDFLAQGEPREGKLIYSSDRVLGYMFRAVSWDETDTPMLASKYDPDTDLEREDSATFYEEDDDEPDLFKDFVMEGSSWGRSSQTGTVQASLRSIINNGPSETHGQPLLSRLGPQATSGVEPSERSTSDFEQAPWIFKDVTFPLLESIGWTYRDFLPGESSDMQNNDYDSQVAAEGHKSVKVFQDFTRHLRGVSRTIASYHPQGGKPWDGLSGAGERKSGTRLVSEVHLLTGRLP